MRQPFVEVSNVQLATMALHEALLCRSFEEFPKHPAAWQSYISYHKLLGWSHYAVLGLLILTLFEVPLWCRSDKEDYWTWKSPHEQCGGPTNNPDTEIILSGIPFLPIGYGLIIEYLLLGVIFVRVTLLAKLHTYFRGVGGAYKPDAELILDYVMILVGFCDAFATSFFPAPWIRIAPFVRFGLAVTIPWVGAVITSFVQVTRSIVTVGIFQIGTVILFAWIAAMIFDDLDGVDMYGMPINQGFENFGNALYSMFAVQTTAVLPDAMVPSYHHNRIFLLFWMPFFLLAVCIFAQVILATVYGEYQNQVQERMKVEHQSRAKGINAAFNYLKDPETKSKNGEEQEVVQYEAFAEVVQVMASFQKSATKMGDDMVRICFDALDDDKSSALSSAEFYDMCDMFQTSFKVTKRDSAVKESLDGTSAGRILNWLMTNGQNGDDPDMGVNPPVGIEPTFPGSPFDYVMNTVLGVNVLWLIVESIYDLNDLEEPAGFASLDLVFSFVYMGEVVMKLCWWSWEEYWMNSDNTFDFITSVILGVAGTGTLIFDAPRDMLRYLNLLRVIRLLKALNNIPEYERITKIITRMIKTCGDVLIMNFLVIYLWTAVGQQLFGGKLIKGNPALADNDDLDFFDSHFQIYNFNDMLLGMITMFFVTITQWIDQITIVCMALYDHYTVGWFATCAFWLSFFVASPLIAFNVFTAFSIDIFLKLEEMSSPENQKLGDIAQNLGGLQKDMAAKGSILHIQESSNLRRERVYKAMFEEAEAEDEAEKDEKQAAAVAAEA